MVSSWPYLSVALAPFPPYLEVRKIFVLIFNVKTFFNANIRALLKTYT